MSKASEIPWKRLTVEAVAIVVSILLAFSIDAWWDNRQRESEVQITISNLAFEFADSADEFERVVVANKMVIAAADRILDKLKIASGPVSLDADSVAGLLMVPTTDPQRGVLDGLIASGNIGWIPNEELRRALANWPAAMDDLVEEEHAAQIFVHEHLLRVLASHTDLSSALQRLVRGRVRGIDTQGVPESLAFLLQQHPISNGSVQIDRPDEFIGLVQTRRHLSQYILFDYINLLKEYDLITGHLESINK